MIANRVRFNARDNASEKMVGICIERDRNELERKHAAVTFVIPNRRYKLRGSSSRETVFFVFFGNFF